MIGSANSWGAQPDAKYGWSWWANFGGRSCTGTASTQERATADASAAYSQMADLHRRETLRSVTTSATKRPDA